jgi:hypothetical protein
MSSRYAEAKPYALPESLADLAGPTRGLVDLPRHLDWGPRYVYDLADEADVLLMYERVIREAPELDDLHAYVNADLLRHHWVDLFLPLPLRGAWETRFPELVTTAAAA